MTTPESSKIDKSLTGLDLPTDHQLDLQTTLHTALLAARLGREVLLHYAGRLKNIQHKFQAGLVSEADQESESVIRGFLKQKFPDFTFLGEESAQAADLLVEKSPVPRWVLDPLDGTTNYVHGLPVYAVSLALEYQGELWVGVVDAPALGEVYAAKKGGGATLNGQPLHVANCQKLEDAFLATGFIADFEEPLKEQLQIFSSVVRKARAVRRAGAAAMDLCWVARGVFDGYWERNLKPWDVAAGQLIVQEAGGVLKNYLHEPHNIFSGTTVAGNPEMVKVLCQALRPELDPKLNPGLSAL